MIQFHAETAEATALIAGSQIQLGHELLARGIRMADSSVATSTGGDLPRHNSSAPAAVIEIAPSGDAEAEPAPVMRRHGRFA